jgi:diaminohydroxyphosphoribosylaminopyrimidine deaminase/5-amino-6-(5-phosphoribosylamino)uracil reductase
MTIHTPPCTDAIIKAGIRRVIIGATDPNPLVCGRGGEKLQAAGIEVVTDLEVPEAQEIIRPFATFITKQRPYVTAKWAMTLDGKMAAHTGDAYWISGPTARTWVHNLRDRVDAVLIGSGTARMDKPQLTVRLSPEQKDYPRSPSSGPLRVVIASHADLPDHLQLFQDNPTKTCVIVGEQHDRERARLLQERGIEIIQVASDAEGHVDLRAALQALGQKGLMHVLLEGGAQLLGSAFDQSLIDHVAAFIAPKLIGGRGAPSPIQGHGLAVMKEARILQNIRHQIFGEDVLIEGEIVNA